MRRRLEALLIQTVLVLAISLTACVLTRAQGTPVELRGQVNDEDGHPVQRAEVTAKWSLNHSFTVYTDAAGQFEIAPIEDRVSVSISKPGYFQTKDENLTLTPGVNEITFALNHETELHQQVNVASGPSQVDPDTTSHQETLVQHEILNTPVSSSHDLQQNLIPMPNVLMDSSGRVHIAGARQGQTEILLDGFEINDPANGSFTPRLNVDAVQTVSVETGGYGAHYSHAGAGILALDTSVGDDKWRFGTTNFFPGISIRDGVRFGNWFPRATLSGPIKKGRAWFSEAISVQHRLTVVNGLPEGQNVATEWAGDNLVRAQVTLTPRNILQGTFLFNRSSDPQTGLGPLTPLSTTTDAQARRYFASVKDQIWIGRTLLELGVADDTGRSTSDPQGNATYVVTPSASSGDYFQTTAQQSRRLQFVGDLTSGSLKQWGTHTLSAGWNADAIDFAQQAVRTAIDFVSADGPLSDLATFSGPAAFRLSNTQIGGYVQDLWRPVKPIVFSVSVRGDWDRLVQQTLVQPRLAVNWLPKEDGRMKFTLAWGEHYQPINLTIVGQGSDQERIDTFYDSTGLIPLGNPVTSQFIVPRTGLSQPRSYNTTAEWDEKISASTFVGAAYLLRKGRDAFAWESEPGGIFLLQNNREDRFISSEVWVRHAFGNGADIMVDYTRSRANSNEVLDPSISALIFAPQQPGPLPWDAPNRVVSRGWTPLPFWQLLFSYFFEYHSGFPFSAINEQQQLVGPANGFRYPSYLSLNVGLEKRFHFRKREWAVRGSAINLTDHQNPTAVVNNVDAPNYLAFSGRQGLGFTARLRLVTQH
ncbi:MAG: carboxypeptidase regulatory-like domain-containing protein [Candidatus Acidiferrales bacterium]|jgi:hypothetical protein